MNSAAFVVDAPRAPTEVAPLLMPEVQRQALAPVPKPQAGGDVLFKLAQKLDARMHSAASAHGDYAGKTTAEWIAWSLPVSGTAFATAAGVATCMATEAHPVLFFVGAVAAGVVLFPVKFGLDFWAKRARANPVSVSNAEPMLEAFKNGDRACQGMVTWQATRWSATFANKNIDGQELRQQLAELAAVTVPADAKTAERIDTIGRLVELMPRKGSDEVDCSSITREFAKLDGDDPRLVGALLLARLFTGERLRTGKADKAAVQALYSTLLATQPRNVTSRETLQQLVSSS